MGLQHRSAALHGVSQCGAVSPNYVWAHDRIAAAIRIPDKTLRLL